MRLGLYLRGIDKRVHAPPKEMARKCADHGVNFVPIMISWQEEDRNKKINSKKLVSYAEAFDEVGIEPWVWGYPWCGREKEFVDRVRWAFERAPLYGVLPDPELGYQGHTVGSLEAARGARTLIEGLLDIMTEQHDIGITSFGAAHIHNTFPWANFCAGFASPQFYKVTNHYMISEGIKRWREAGWTTFIPSVPTFGPNSGKKLSDYLDVIKAVAGTAGVSLEGWIFWSLRQTGELEWRVIESLARQAHP